MSRRRNAGRGNAISKALYTLAALSLLLAAGAFSWPYAAKSWNDMLMQSLTSGYEQAESNGETEQEALKAADAYNETLYKTGGQETMRLAPSGSGGTASIMGKKPNTDKEYESLLAGENGIMGSVRIPRIGVTQPIYHYATDEVLAKGTGHFYGSSLPVGGMNTHAVVTGHSGLMTSHMFDRLRELRKGDVFILSSFGRKCAYRVDDIRTVLPDRTESLRIMPGKDLATLVTCTPYGVNTHRLLVTGHRVPAKGAVKAAERAEKENQTSFVAFVLLTAASVAAFIVVVIRIWRRQVKDMQKGEKKDVRQTLDKRTGRKSGEGRMRSRRHWLDGSLPCRAGRGRRKGGS